MEGLKLTEPNTTFTASDILTFYGSFLSFIGTVILGVVAAWQTKKAHYLNAKLLNLDSKRENEKLFEMYFSFMEQCEKVFNPSYILGDPKEERTFFEIFYTIKNCKITALGIMRRLLFLDKANAENKFLEYAIGKIEEIAEIALKYSKEESELTHQLFCFMIDNNDEFNKKSFVFISAIHKSIFGDKHN